MPSCHDYDGDDDEFARIPLTYMNLSSPQQMTSSRYGDFLQLPSWTNTAVVNSTGL